MGNRWIRYTVAEAPVQKGNKRTNQKGRKRASHGRVRRINKEISQPLSYMLSRYGPLTEAKLRTSKTKSTLYLEMCPAQKSRPAKESWMLSFHYAMCKGMPRKMNALPQGIEKPTREGGLVERKEEKSSRVFFDSFINELSDWARFTLSILAGASKFARIRSEERGDKFSEKEERRMNVFGSILESVAGGFLALVYLPVMLYSSFREGVLNARSECFKLIEDASSRNGTKKKGG